MATLRQKPNKYWYIRYRDVDGKPKEAATGLKTVGKRPSDEVKEQLGHVIKRERNARLAKDEPKSKLEPKTVLEAWLIYEPWLELHRKEATWRNSRTAFTNYFVPEWDDALLDDLTVERIDNFFARIYTVNDLSARHCNTLRIYLQGFFSWSMKRGYCISNPAKEVEPIGEGAPSNRSLTLEHCLLILQELEGQDRAIWGTLFLSGVRLGECKGLQRGDVHTADHKLVVERSVYKRGATAIKKTGAPFQKTKSGPSVRDITIPGLLSNILREWRKVSRDNPNPYDLLFTNPRTHGVFDEDDFRQALREAASRAAPKVKGDEPLVVADAQCHLARSAFARAFLSLGGNIEDLRRTLGHSRIQTTMRYLKWSPGFQKSAFDLITPAKVGIAVGIDYTEFVNDVLRGLQ